MTGFLIAALLPAPPVYDPGGLTCQIDDFTVGYEEKWATTGPALLRAGLAEAARRGAVQAVVVTAHLDASQASGATLLRTRSRLCMACPGRGCHWPVK